jgi:hypothetical protein
MTTLEARVSVLESIEAIRALKARYAAFADAKYRPDYTRVGDAEMARIARAQSECFTADAVWDGGGDFGDSRHGREALRQWFMNSPWRFAMHYYGSPCIDVDVDGDQASATWRLWQIALREDNGEAVLLCALTNEAYRRDAAGVWLCSYMRFDEVHMAPLHGVAGTLARTFDQLVPKDDRHD